MSDLINEDKKSKLDKVVKEAEKKVDTIEKKHKKAFKAIKEVLNKKSPLELSTEKPKAAAEELSKEIKPEADEAQQDWWWNTNRAGQPLGSIAPTMS